MKKSYLKGSEVKIIKELGIKDKAGTWVQIEFLDGKQKGFRMPAILEELKDSLTK
jgi:hypothetical protein